MNLEQVQIQEPATYKLGEELSLFDDTLILAKELSRRRGSLPRTIEEIIGKKSRLESIDLDFLRNLLQHSRREVEVGQDPHSAQSAVATLLKMRDGLDITESEAENLFRMHPKRLPFEVKLHGFALPKLDLSEARIGDRLSLEGAEIKWVYLDYIQMPRANGWINLTSGKFDMVTCTRVDLPCLVTRKATCGELVISDSRIGRLIADGVKLERLVVRRTHLGDVNTSTFQTSADFTLDTVGLMLKGDWTHEYKDGYRGKLNHLLDQPDQLKSALLS